MSINQGTGSIDNSELTAALLREDPVIFAAMHSSSPYARAILMNPLRTLKEKKQQLRHLVKQSYQTKTTRDFAIPEKEITHEVPVEAVWHQRGLYDTSRKF